MLIRIAFFTLLSTILLSCQTIMRYHFGIKKPDIEKKETAVNLIEKNKIDQSCFLKKEEIYGAYIGPFPKVYVFDKNGYEVILPDCYEVIESNLRKLVDTIPDQLSSRSFRDDFVKEKIRREEGNNLIAGQYDYEVFFYWSVWLGKFNIKKLRLAQQTINSINQTANQKRIVLIPVNFDFIKEEGWTKKTMEAEIQRISKAQKAK